MKTLKWLIAAPILAFILFNVYAYGNIISYRALAPHHTAFMNMRMSEIAQEKPQVALSYQWVPYNQIAENLKKALIASEDANFAEHDGFDWNGIKNAIKKNEKSGKIKAGCSSSSPKTCFSTKAAAIGAKPKKPPSPPCWKPPPIKTASTRCI